MIKKMNCPFCGTELENDAIYADVEEGFQCAKCGKDFDEEGKENNMDTLLDIVRSEVNQGINNIFYQIQNRAGIKHGDIAPEQEFKLDALKEEMIETMLEVIKEEL